MFAATQINGWWWFLLIAVGCLAECVALFLWFLESRARRRDTTDRENS